MDYGWEMRHVPSYNFYSNDNLVLLSNIYHNIEHSGLSNKRYKLILKNKKFYISRKEYNILQLKYVT